MSLEISDLQIPPPADETTFEKLCLDLYRAEFGDKTQLHGRRGQKQHGVDIFVPDKNIGIQCKKIDFNKQNTQDEIIKILKEEIEKAKNFQPPLKRFILAITCKRDAKIQKEARLISKRHKDQDLFSVEVHSWEDIKDLLDKHPTVCQKYYPHLHTQNTQASISTFTISPIQQESRHQELNTIRDLINKNKPETAFELLESFKKEKWTYLPDEEKYRVLNYMSCIQIDMGKTKEGYKFLIQAYQYNKSDIDANINCAFALLSQNNTQEAEEHIKKAKEINPYSERLHEILIFLSRTKRKPLSEIEQNVPEDIRNKTRIAFYLSQVAAQYNIHDKAKYWAEIAYNSEETKPHFILSHYASVLLYILYENTFLKQAPDSYKTDISVAIKIYKKLLADQYTEIKKYHPEWYGNLSRAYELLGNTDKTIQTIREAINIYPENINFKLYLAEILIKYDKDLDEAITILHNPKTPLGSKMLLSEALFLKGQHEESIATLDSIINAKNTSVDMYTEALRLKTLRLIQLKKYKEAEQSLHLFEEKNPTDVVVFILKSKIEFAKNNLEEAKSLSIKAKDQITKNTHPQDIKLLAHLMFNMGLYEPSESLFEKMIDKNLNHPDIFNLLRVYFENGKNKQAIDLANTLLKKFPDKTDAVEILFHIYMNLGDKNKAIQCCEKFLKENPKNDSVRLGLIQTYLQNEQTLKVKDILQNMSNLDQLSAQQMSHLSYAYMKTGDTKKALETQYKCIKKYPNDPMPHSTYFDLITFLNPDDEHLFLHPKTVDLDCYVKYKNIETSKEHEIVIEEDAEIYKPNHEFSKALIGRKTGDTVTFGNSETFGSPKQYQVIEIMSKYIYKYRKIGEEAERKFASNTFLTNISIPKNANAQTILKTLQENLPKMSTQQKNLDELLQYYQNGQLTIGVMAQALRKHPIDIMTHLIHSSKDKFISSVPAWENPNKIQEILDHKTDILIDLSSLIMIHELGINKHIEESKFNLYICQSTLDSLQKYIEEKALHSQDDQLMLGRDDKGELKPHSIPAQTIKQNLIFWNKVKTWAKEHCKIKPISTDVILSRQKIQESERALGKESFDSVLATDTNMIFLCEDAILRKLTEKGFSKSGVRVFDLVEYFERQAIINNTQAVKFKAQLVKLNHTYIPIDHNILLCLFRDAKYLLTDTGVQRGLFFLGNVSALPGVINITANFLMEIYQEPSLLPYRQHIITTELLNKISNGRNSNRIAYQIINLIQIRAKLLPLLQNEICKDLLDWLKSKIY